MCRVTINRIGICVICQMLDRFVYLFVADLVSFVWFFIIVTLVGLTCFVLVFSFVVFLFTV